MTIHGPGYRWALLNQSEVETIKPKGTPVPLSSVEYMRDSVATWALNSIPLKSDLLKFTVNVQLGFSGICVYFLMVSLPAEPVQPIRWVLQRHKTHFLVTLNLAATLLGNISVFY